MMVTTTKLQRSVLLGLKFMKDAHAQPGIQLVEGIRVGRISALFSDVDGVTVSRFDESDERSLLRRFWRSIRPNDRIFARNAVDDFARLRRRSWLLGLIPSLAIDLRSVYCVQLWDPARMWIDGYVPGPLFMTQPPVEQNPPIIPNFEEANSNITG
jgi:hypothetical protein